MQARFPNINSIKHTFDVPIKAAAAQLNISVTMLKRICRMFGFNRWPGRKVRIIDFWMKITAVGYLTKIDGSLDNFQVIHPSRLNRYRVSAFINIINDYDKIRGIKRSIRLLKSKGVSPKINKEIEVLESLINNIKDDPGIVGTFKHFFGWTNYLRSSN